MAKYFTFLDRTLELRFFAEDPITVSIPMGDDMEQLLMEMGKNMDEAGDYGHAMEALYPILGRENTEKILSRSDRQDCYAAEQLAAFRRLPVTLEEARSAAMASEFVRGHLPSAILTAWGRG